MKIVHVYKDFDPPVHGGMEHHMALMCRFQRQWADVEAITCSRSLATRVVDRAGTRVTEVAEWIRFQSAPFSPTFPWHVRRIDADVAVVHVPNPTAEISFLMARLPRTKVVVRYQSDIVRQARAMRYYAPLQSRFLRRADAILVATHQYLDSSPTLHPLREKCSVIPLGVLPAEFENPDERRVDELRALYGNPFVLFSGRHRYYKGLEYLVRAAAAIHAPVVIAGDGPERESLRSLARSLGVSIQFPGSLAQPDLIAHLHACAVFAFPSVERSEAYGIAMLEAHACRRPVVATTLGTGVEFVNLHEKTGLNVPPRDPEALAAAINALLDNDDLRAQMGDYARHRIQTELHAERIAKAEFDFYRSLL